MSSLIHSGQPLTEEVVVVIGKKVKWMNANAQVCEGVVLNANIDTNEILVHRKISGVDVRDVIHVDDLLDV